MESFFKGTGKLTKKQLERNLQTVQMKLFPPPDVDLSWHVRAWGWWVLQQAKADLERFYPVLDGKPTVAYLWARTVKCKNCRALLPLLKTRWLCKKDAKRVLLTMEPNADKTGVTFGIQKDVPVVGGNSAQKREHDKRVGAGTMSKSGAQCPCCSTIMTMEDIRFEGKAERLSAVMTAVVVDGNNGKEYRLPTENEITLAAEVETELEAVDIPFGIPNESLPSKEALGFRVPLYGLDQWHKLFTSRQLYALAIFIKHTRLTRGMMLEKQYSLEWVEAIEVYLGVVIDRIADRGSSICHWDLGYEKVANTFSGFRLPMSWDFAETSVTGDKTGSYTGQLEWVARYIEHGILATSISHAPKILNQSAIIPNEEQFDVILTDPPYYDAIPYSDLMDFFYIWLRRTTYGLAPEFDKAFYEPLAPKWNHETNDGELIDDSSRFGGDKAKSKTNYEDGMARVFQACYKSLTPDGRLVIVFAHKHPDAWETLVSAIIRAGFVVDGSWPIQTEMGNRTRALSSAALSSSVWLVCKKRPTNARPGWDNRVLDEMREKLNGRWDDETKQWAVMPRLRDYWDAGIRGPDFIWAATGPALEAYSRYPIVKKANDPGKLLTVTDFLSVARRMVLDFVVGRVLFKDSDSQPESGLDEVTTYYLLHRNDFKMDKAPIGACILYAVSCGLSDHALADQLDILIRAGGQTGTPEEDLADEDSPDTEETIATEGTGSQVKLKPWQQRVRKTMGYEAANGRPIPLIDQVHRLMHLWKAGDVVKVNQYLDDRALRRNEIFKQLLQALIELSTGDERALLESLSNHLGQRGSLSDVEQIRLELTSD